MSNTQAIQAFTKRFNDLYEAKGAKTKKLARDARVSPTSIVKLKRPDRVRAICLSPRSREEMREALERILRALREDPGSWLKEWDSIMDISLYSNMMSPRPGDVRKRGRDGIGWIVRGALAEERQENPDAVVQIEKAFRDDPNDSVLIDFGILTEKSSRIQNQRRFLEKFLELIMVHVNNRLSPRCNRRGDGELCARPRDIESFHETWLRQRTLDPAMMFRGVLGVSESRYRSDLYDVDFVRIPGLCFPLFFLAEEGAATARGLSWEQVIRAPRHRSPGRNAIRVLALEEEIGALYIQEAWGHETNRDYFEVVARPIYFRAVARRFVEMLEEDAESGDKYCTVLVGGDEWSASILQEIGRIKRGMGLIDLAADADPSEEVPSFCDAIAIRNDGPRWKECLTQAVRDSFIGTDTQTDTATKKGVLEMAANYAEFFFRMVEADTDRVIAAIHAHRPVPARFRIRRFGVPLSREFRDHLEQTLLDLLGSSKIADYKQSIIADVLPWKKNAERELEAMMCEYGIENLRRALERCAGQSG
jgi:hypothetical protein